MSALPHLITDLALILVTAGVVTVLFKRLRQPLVLGYIVAGFLASPYMPYTPSVSDGETISLWSELGVIFLMFSLGLEFSFKKILVGGLRPLLTTLSLMGCMLAVGYVVGHSLLGLSPLGSLFVGSMLSISSTTIIYKVYAETGLNTKRFASTVMSVLVLEDIFAIVLMALLGSLCVGESANVLFVLGRLSGFLVLWLVVGIIIIPRLLRRLSAFIGRETLLIVSLGLCFLMVVIAHRAGYGAELGAFVMGSILSESVQAEKINSSVDSIKDLFGAVFFVSVGMMVQPSMLVEYWREILLLVGVVVISHTLFGTLAFRLSCSSLCEATSASFSMVQIGEFSFIIASMGIVSGALEEWTYPVIVAVSILTTFLTPYSIRLANQSKGSKKTATAPHVTQLTLPLTTTWAGKTLAELSLGTIITAIERDTLRLPLPAANTMLFPRDIIEVVGDDESIDLLKQRLLADTMPMARREADPMQTVCLVVGKGSPFAGISIRQSEIRDRYECLVIGRETDDKQLATASPDYVIRPGDKLWVAGNHNNIHRLKQMI